MGKIGTHNGTFHCDEVFGCVMLKILPEFNQMDIVRTRDPQVLNSCDIVIDVGAVYDHESKRYDHHQASFHHTLNSIHPDLNFHIKLSSAGLIYAHYGQRVIAKILEIEDNDPCIPTIYKKLYQSFVMEIDAIDNGVKQSQGKMNYVINSDLSTRVSYCNPTWNDPNPDETSGFYEAMEMVHQEFSRSVNFFFKSWIPARDLVQKAYSERKTHHSSGNLLVFVQSPPIWKDHLLDIEEKEITVPDSSHEYNGRVVICIYPRENGDWSVQAVPKNHRNKFESRVLLPLEWRGHRDAKLDELVGVEGCVMVHATGFLAIHKTFTGAICMAETALKEEKLL